ncbi:polymer-forming cytoskeletal protein [Herminiimonas sp. NPDC097707]|uniref:bactofilin family protein n=1 Tax=Herminiimonas sp. NPDC097707 TaxID=3364007 RepID=UPI003839D799
MLRSDTLFGKRESNTPNPSLSTNSSPALSTTTGQGFNKPVSSSAGGFNSPASTHASNPSVNEVGSKLIVGPNIKLKGVEITDCDTLVVEGFVEATMDSRVIQIAKEGSFKGSAGIDIAEIHGTFDGELTVRQKLVIYASGKVSGKIRYGNVVIEEGGQLMGDVQVVGANTSMPPKGLTVAKAV